MHRRNKSILLLFALILLPFIAVLIFRPALEKKVSRLLVETINKNLSVPVEVKEIRLNLWRHFPRAGLDFYQVHCKGRENGGPEVSLVQAGQVSLLFAYSDLFADRVRVRKLLVRDARLHLTEDLEGKSNYDVFKTDEAGESGIRTTLDEVLLDHCRMDYQSLINEQHYSFRITAAGFKGDFNQQRYSLAGNASFVTDTLITGGVNYGYGLASDLQLAIDIDRQRKEYTVSSADLKIADLLLKGSGTIREQSDGFTYRIEVGAFEAGLRELLSIVPGVYTKALDRYDYSGKIDFAMKLEKSRPGNRTVLAEFGTKSASVRPAGTKDEISKIRFAGQFRSVNGKEVLILRDIGAQIDGQPLRGSLRVENFSQPDISFDVDCKLNLETLSKFWKPDTVESMTGSADVRIKARGKGKISSHWLSEGDLTIRSLAMKLRGSDYLLEVAEGQLLLNGDAVLVNGLRGKAAGSDFNVNGKIDHLLTWLLTPDARLRADMQLVAQKIDLNEILLDPSKSERQVEKYRLELPDRIELFADFKIGELRFRKFDARSLTGKIRLQNPFFSVENLQMETCSGQILLSGQIESLASDSLKIEVQSTMRSIDIRQLFEQTGNFGQEVITEKNLKGRLSAETEMQSLWSRELSCRMDAVKVRSKLSIEQGELIGFEPLMALSRYLKNADLKHIRFSTLSNTISISNRLISIPAMEINSSALDLLASGTHSFDNVIDYRMQLLLSQLKGKKEKSFETEFGTIEDDGLGRTRIYLAMKGPAADPKITLDRKGSAEKISNEIKKEKESLKTILRREFGSPSHDSIPKSPGQTKPERKPELELEAEE